MPTYSYLCDACGGSFEVEQRISESPIEKCSLCGKPKARRQIVSANFILKGGGWYSDGYGNTKSKSDAKSESSSKPEAKETKSDSSTTTTTPAAPSAPAKTETKATAAE